MGLLDYRSQMMNVRSIPAARLAAALGLLAMLLVTSAQPMGVEPVVGSPITVVSGSEWIESPFESLGVPRLQPMGAVPAPRAGRLRVREADRVGPHRLYLPPPAAC